MKTEITILIDTISLQGIKESKLLKLFPYLRPKDIPVILSFASGKEKISISIELENFKRKTIILNSYKGNSITSKTIQDKSITINN